MAEISTTRSGNVLVPYVDAKKITKQVPLTVAGTNWATIRAQGLAYADSNGVWRVRFNIEGNLSSDQGSNIISIDGVIFKQGVYQGVYASAQDAAGNLRSVYTDTGSNSSDINIGTVANTYKFLWLSGDVELESKPTWADANLEDVAAVDVFIAENSLPGSKMLDNSIPVSKLVGSGSGPAGMVVAFPAATAPTGWAICDGSEVSKTTYASLFSTIGTTWDTCTNPLTGATYSSPVSGNFRLPDLRGTFLRGAGNFVDDTKDTVLGGFQGHNTAADRLSTSASYVTGSVGGSDGTHIHRLNYGSGQIGSGAQSVIGGLTNDAGVQSELSGHGHSVTGTQLTAAAQGLSGDSETRPQNVGVNFIIKLFD